MGYKYANRVEDRGETKTGDGAGWAEVSKENLPLCADLEPEEEKASKRTVSK